MTSIIQPWAAELGLRHQGVLVSAIRGPDTEEREDVSKYLTRVLRGAVLVPHCKDLSKAVSYMMALDGELWDHSAADFLRGFDHYPLHWLSHFMHACEIIGYKHPDEEYRRCFGGMYASLCRKLHVNAEAEWQLDGRLNASEHDFGLAQAAL